MEKEEERVEKLSLVYTREGRATEKINHDLIIYENAVFGDINGKATYVEYQRFPPLIRIFPLRKLPAGYVSEREFVFMPVQPEEIEKMLHPLLVAPYISEFSVIHDTVYLKSLTPEALRGDIIRVRNIRIGNGFVVLRRGQRRSEIDGEFEVEERKDTRIPVIKRYRFGRESYKLEV